MKSLNTVRSRGGKCWKCRRSAACFGGGSPQQTIFECFRRVVGAWVQWLCCWRRKLCCRFAMPRREVAVASARTPPHQPVPFACMNTNPSNASSVKAMTGTWQHQAISTPLQPAQFCSTRSAVCARVSCGGDMALSQLSVTIKHHYHGFWASCLNPRANLARDATLIGCRVCFD